MTFAIAARVDGGWVAGASTYPVNVGRNVLNGRSGLGIALSLGYAPPEPSLGLLAAIDQGSTVNAAVEGSMSQPGTSAWLIGVLNSYAAAGIAGPESPVHSGLVVREDLVVCAALMRVSGVPEAIAASWDNAAHDSPIDAVRHALTAGRAAGGDLRGMHSAALMLVPASPADAIRVAEVNYHPDDPIAELANVEFVNIDERPSLETRLDHGNAAWSALMAGEVEQAADHLEMQDGPLAESYAGAINYLWTAIHVRRGDWKAAEGSIRRLHEVNPEWIECAARGEAFADELHAALELVGGRLDRDI